MVVHVYIFLLCSATGVLDVCVCVYMMVRVYFEPSHPLCPQRLTLIESHKKDKIEAGAWPGAFLTFNFSHSFICSHPSNI